MVSKEQFITPWDINSTSVDIVGKSSYYFRINSKRLIPVGRNCINGLLAQFAKCLEAISKYVDKKISN